MGPFGFPDYPDVQLRTSANQLARFMMALSGGGRFKDTRILAKATVDELETPQIPFPGAQPGAHPLLRGLGPYHLVGHSGMYLGTSTDMYFDPATGAGFIMLSNGNLYGYDSDRRVASMVRLERRLLEVAEHW